MLDRLIDVSMKKRNPREARRFLPFLITLSVVGFSGFVLWTALQRYNDTKAEALATGPVTKRPRVFSTIYQDKGKQFLWAIGPKIPEDKSSEWFDMTGSPLVLEEINHGLGRDTIASIDHPLFVDPDDPRLRRRWGGRDDANIDNLDVIGYEHNSVARAYPIALLTHHELVNDTVGGKPVTVGW